MYITLTIIIYRYLNLHWNIFLFFRKGAIHKSATFTEKCIYCKYDYLYPI